MALFASKAGVITDGIIDGTTPSILVDQAGEAEQHQRVNECLDYSSGCDATLHALCIQHPNRHDLTA